MVVLRSLCRAAVASAIGAHRLSRSSTANQHLSNRYLFSRSFFGISSSPRSRTLYDYSCRGAMDIGKMRNYSEDLSHMPQITDPNVNIAFKDLMAANWEELPTGVIHGAKTALSKNSDDKSGQEALTNVFRAAEAVEEFGGILTSLKMELDDSIGMSGENVKPLSNDIINALHTAYQRYADYLDAFGPEEVYLKKKVEMELGTKMIHLKMRCSGLGSEWGKVTVLGTSGLSGSYVEQRS